MLIFWTPGTILKRHQHGSILLCNLFIAVSMACQFFSAIESIEALAQCCSKKVFDFKLKEDSEQYDKVTS